MTQNRNQNIIYLDTNNLCGYAMSNFLPTVEFKWMDPKEFDSINITVIAWKVAF